jgi:hypothetical protein
MPTAAKLMSAVAFAIVGWFAACAYIPGLPEGTQTRNFPEITAFLGLLIGWLVMGVAVGKGYWMAMGSGIRTSITIVFWALVGFSIYDMVLESMKMRYDGPMEAVVATFGIMIDYGALLAQSQVIAVLAVGGIIGGLLAEAVGRRWK